MVTLHKARYLILCLLIALSTPADFGQSTTAPEVINVNAAAPSHSFPHFWEQMFGSGRAVLSLRDSYRQDMRDVKQITGFQYVRFHAIFDDDVGVYRQGSDGQPRYNFSYVDQIYDGLLANGVKPFVELSFMPTQLAAKPLFQAFWYKPNVSPPRDWQAWDDLIAAFVQHLVARYGIDEVASWYFEVWNEPNIDFWAGDPKQATYFDLYDHTAQAIKKVDSRLRVGGPATAQAAWVDVFIQHCAASHIPLDFVSTHVYANDTALDVFGTTETIPRDQMVCRAVGKVHNQIRSSKMPDLPLIWSEFNASYKNEPDVTDSVYMGPWLADTIRQCDGLVDMMSYWTFSDVFEEQGVVETPFYGGFGLIAAGGIPKPSYQAFKLLHLLGDQRIALASDSAVLTRRSDGTLALAVWNYAPPGEAGPSKDVTLRFQNANVQHATIWRLDEDHGNVHREYTKLDEPRYPTQAQIQELRSSEAITPQAEDVKNGSLTLEMPSHGLALIELQ